MSFEQYGGGCFRYKDLAAKNGEVGEVALALYCATVRATLFVCKGYECQEKEGVFMTAFPGPIKALEWAVTLQMALLRSALLKATIPPCSYVKLSRCASCVRLQSELESSCNYGALACGIFVRNPQVLIHWVDYFCGLYVCSCLPLEDHPFTSSVVKVSGCLHRPVCPHHLTRHSLHMDQPDRLLRKYAVLYPGAHTTLKLPNMPPGQSAALC